MPKRKPSGWIAIERDDRPWWAFWRRHTVTVRCSEHGVVASGIADMTTELGWTPAISIRDLHMERHVHGKDHRGRKSQDVQP